MDVAHKDFKAAIGNMSKNLRENIHTMSEKKGKILKEFKVEKESFPSPSICPTCLGLGHLF